MKGKKPSLDYYIFKLHHPLNNSPVEPDEFYIATENEINQFLKNQDRYEIVLDAEKAVNESKYSYVIKALPINVVDHQTLEVESGTHITINMWDCPYKTSYDHISIDFIYFESLNEVGKYWRAFYMKLYEPIWKYKRSELKFIDKKMLKKYPIGTPLVEKRQDELYCIQYGNQILDCSYSHLEGRKRVLYNYIGIIDRYFNSIEELQSDSIYPDMPNLDSFIFEIIADG